MASTKLTPCECVDRLCSVHLNTECHRWVKDIEVLYRIDMEDEYGTQFCRGCAQDAMKSGVFAYKWEEE